MKRPYSDINELATTVGGENPKLQNRVVIAELAKILKDMERRLDTIERNWGNVGHSDIPDMPEKSGKAS